MKYCFVFILFFLPLYVTAQVHIKKDTIKVPYWHWVEYAENGVKQNWANGTTYSEQSDVCGLEYGGSLIVLDEVDTNLMLCRYYTEKNSSGTPCENDIAVLIEKNKIKNWNELYSLRVEKEKIRASKINNILNNSYKEK